MRFNYHISSVKTKVIVAAAAIFLLLAADWCSPGAGLHRAAVMLGGYGALDTAPLSLWGVCVRLIGWNIHRLGLLSLVSALVALACYLALVGDLAYSALEKAKLRDVEGTRRYDGVTSFTTLLAGVSFLFSPGFLMAATRVDPLMTALALVFSGVVIMVSTSLLGEENGLVELVKHPFRLTVALFLLGFGGWEFLTMGSYACHHAIRQVGWFVLFGFLPLYVFLNLVRWRKILKPNSMQCFLMMWTILLLVVSIFAVRATTRGREVSRMVDQIVANAQSCDAILSEGYLDDILLFTKPHGLRLISLVRDNDEEYRRDMVNWVEEQKLTNLVWAAEIGPRTLIDEWVRTDPEGCLRKVRTSAYYFPKVEKWRAACDLLKKISPTEPLGAYVRKLVTACGNDIACCYLDEGRDLEAWNLFWEILNTLDSENCTVIANVYGMIRRGYLARSDERNRLKLLNQLAILHHRTPQKILWAVFSGGRVFRPKTGERRDPNDESILSGLDEGEREFIKTVAGAPSNALSAERALEAIRKGIATGFVRLDRIGAQLLRLDLCVKDWDRAEKDALDILALNGRHPTANHIMGLVKFRKGDLFAAERHLRASLAVNHSDVRVINDLAFVLLCGGRYREAVRFASAAAMKRPTDWNFRETLALAQIRGGQLVEGEQTLLKAVQMAKSSGISRSKVARFDMDLAWLHAGLKNEVALRRDIETLSARSDLTDLQKRELGTLRALLGDDKSSAQK